VDPSAYWGPGLIGLWFRAESGRLGRPMDFQHMGPRPQPMGATVEKPPVGRHVSHHFPRRRKTLSVNKSAPATAARSCQCLSLGSPKKGTHRPVLWILWFRRLAVLANRLVAGVPVMLTKPSMLCHLKNTCCSDCCLFVSTNSIEYNEPLFNSKKMVM